MERRLADIPTEEWGDVSVDITPREYVLDYLAHSFPTQLFEPFTDEEGNLSSRPVFRDGQPVQCRDAVERRDRMIERLAALPPVRARSTRSCSASAPIRSPRSPAARAASSARATVSAVENRAGSANLAEAQAFMDDEKRILVFSDAGGTGRSYHADLGARNRRLRVHYLLEAGWKADTAIQGLGRSNRTNQAQPPLFRPVATNVKAEKRFLSTIARRLDTLGAITRGQRQTGGQGLFRADDNLESVYGRAALRQLYRAALQRQGRGLLAASLRGRDRPVAHRQRRQLARGAAADHDLPQSPARAHHRPAEHAVRGVRGTADGEDRRRHRLGHLRSRRRDADRREPRDHRAPHRLYPSGRPAPRRRCSPSPAATATSRSRSTRRWSGRADPRARLLRQCRIPAAPRCRCRRQA